VLEYGIGTGRIALPIARAGSLVVGVDRSRAMLGELRARVANEPAEVRRRIRTRYGDMRRVKLGRRFPLVLCPFNAALHLYERQDVDAWLSRVREHIEPRGELVVDISMPTLEDLADPPGTSYDTPSFDHPTYGRVNYREIFDYDRVRQILFVSMCFTQVSSLPPGTKPRSLRNEPLRKGEIMVPLAHRQFFPREWEALLHYNGFEATDVFGDFDRGPLTQSSDVMVWHARPRKSHR
jgi:SAM-dependent methyltransferase